jgi:hypothetical protein
MPRPGLPHARSVTILPVVLCASLCATPLSARNPDLSKYPLRVHVLAADESYRTPRMKPGLPASCDAVDGMLASINLNSGVPVSLNGFSGDPCAIGPDFMRGGMLDTRDEDPVFSGSGRADLVTPPITTQGLTFHYDNCSRVRVHPGFQSLPARWKKPGQKLEVLIPSDAIPVNDRPLPPERCTMTVTLHHFVYLLLRNGTLIEISQEDYWKKPALRVFLSGNAQPIQPRRYTVPAHPVN